MTTVADTRPLRHWLHAAEGTHLVVGCAEHPDTGGWSRAITRPGRHHAVVQLATCVGLVSPAVLLELVAGGARGITVALDGCAHPRDAEAVVSRAGTLLSALGRPESIDIATELPRERKPDGPWPILGENVPVSRRAILGRRDGLDLPEPARRPSQRLLAVLAELGYVGGPDTALDAIPTGIPMLTASGCGGSGACTRVCPAGALALTRTVLSEGRAGQDAIEQFQLTFDPGRCTDCGLCLQVCPAFALQRSGEHLWSTLRAGERVGLRVGLVRRCDRCGGPNAGSGHVCAVCAYRAANPFGSRMPPGLRGEGTSGAAGHPADP